VHIEQATHCCGFQILAISQFKQVPFAVFQPCQTLTQIFKLPQMFRRRESFKRRCHQFHNTFVEQQSIAAAATQVEPDLILGDAQSPKKRSVGIVAGAAFEDCHGGVLQDIIAIGEIPDD